MNKSTNILITAGGTIVKIDDVRHIANFSTGSFLAKIANACLRRGYNVVYFYAKNGKTPGAHKGLRIITFETYEDYFRGLRAIFKNNRIDIVFLGAAVSDYGTIPRKGKISVSRPVSTLRLFKLPKVIKWAKKWSRAPVFQVGFKLLSGVSEKELVEAAHKSGLESQSDVTIANDIKKIKSGRLESFIIIPEKGVIKFTEPNLAKKLVEFIEKRAFIRHFKTVLASDKSFNSKYAKEQRTFKNLCRRLSRKGMMPEFFSGSESGHGSLALRVGGASFLITARGSNKKNLRSGDTVLVQKVDWKKRKIIVNSAAGKKASFNAVLAAAIFKKFPRINAVVHAHSFAKKAPTTDFLYTPGSLEYAIKPLSLFENGICVINLKNHGLVSMGESLEQAVNHVLT